MLRKKCFNMYVHQKLVAFTEHRKKILEKNTINFVEWGPLGAGAD